ncbi:hypothetical protein VTK73DRAFT_4418 [Phialemonium thermophilum]|uniref:Uncharacterized protein n=1 Tax=Phialemonium thermophilum TaxID=223376 RepID=A0ABR3WTH2_9PEZI
MQGTLQPLGVPYLQFQQDILVMCGEEAQTIQDMVHHIWYFLPFTTIHHSAAVDALSALFCSASLTGGF